MASSEPGTEAGRTLFGSLENLKPEPRRRLRQFILAIEAEAIAAERERIVRAVEGLRSLLYVNCDGDEREDTRGVYRSELRAIIDGAS